MFLKRLKNKVTLFYLSLLVISAILEALFRLSQNFAELYTVRVSPILKSVFIPIGVLPFSVSETLFLIFLLLFLTLLSCLVIHFLHLVLKKRFTFNYRTIFVLLVRSLIIVVFLFVSTFSSSYHRIPVAQHMNLNVESDEERLIRATEILAQNLIEISEKIPFESGKASASEMSFRSLSKELKHAADKAEKHYDFLKGSGSLAKPFSVTEPLTYMHIAGIYTFFTTEPCINTNYSGYTIPYTIAHEYAHQRGIGAENEADFVAFLITMQSSDPYVKYSGFAEAFVTLSNELYKNNPDEFYDITSTLPPVVLNDFQIESRTYSKYSNSTLGEITSDMNDTYLKLNGVESGVLSYSESALLLMAYLT